MELLPRTYLFVPGDRPERFDKALMSGADRIIIDLEDAVKPEAKATARKALMAACLDEHRVVVRINEAACAEQKLDLACITKTDIRQIIVPKVESAESLHPVRAAIGDTGEIIPQIETAAGLHSLNQILKAPGVRRCAFGHLDFALDLGCMPDWEALLLVRSEIVLQSRLAGAHPPVDSITTDLTDEGAVREEAERARRMGFGGKLLIHPGQVTPVQAVFLPSPQEIDWAKRVLAAEATSGAVEVDGRMVDKPVVDAARVILKNAPS